jgi:hypothetical protein
LGFTLGKLRLTHFVNILVLTQGNADSYCGGMRERLGKETETYLIQARLHELHVAGRRPAECAEYRELQAEVWARHREQRQMLNDRN